MAQTHPKLSPIKEIYCINCHEELILDLAERRGEKQIICPKCKTSFSIKKAEKFMSNISPITEGKCPGCLGELIFDIEDRISKDKVKCPICKDLFYMREVINPLSQVREKEPIGNKTELTAHSKEDENNFDIITEDLKISDYSFLLIPKFISNIIMDTGVEYFSTSTIFSIEVTNGEEKISDIKNVFEDVPIQAICFKLFHNKIMISSYAVHYPIDDSRWSFEDFQLKPTDNYYLELEVSAGGVNILDKKGYGLFSINHKGIINTLMKFDSAFKDYIANLVQEDSKYNELLRISNFTTYNSEKDLDFITVEFLLKNRDFFANYL